MIEFPKITLRMAPMRLLTEDPQAIMDLYVTPVWETMFEEISRRTRWQAVEEGYYWGEVTSRNTDTYYIGNTSDLWVFEEEDIQPHDIPQPARTQPPPNVPAGKLLDWMASVGIPEEMYFLIRSKLQQRGWVTHHPGSQGDHIAMETFEQFKPALYDAHVQAINAMIMGTGAPIEIL
jgi:hypothetical protein